MRKRGYGFLLMDGLLLMTLRLMFISIMILAMLIMPMLEMLVQRQEKTFGMMILKRCIILLSLVMVRVGSM